MDDERVPQQPPRGRGRFIDLRGRSLREHAARGTVLNSAFAVGLSLMGFVRGFLLAALITTADYGVWGIVSVSLGTLLWLRSVGIGDRFVQQDEPDQELAFQKAFTLQLSLCMIFVVILLAAVPAMMAVYGESDLLGPALLFIATVPAAAFQSPLWVYYRRMQFARQRTLQAIDPVLGFIVTIGLAAAGLGFWSIAIGNFVGSWGGALVTTFTSPFRLRLRMDRGTLKRYWGFSWPLFIAIFWAAVIAQSSVIATEAQLGLAGAGAVALAASISQFTDRVDQVVTGTLYPAVVAVKDKTELLYESFVKSNRLALMWAVPFGFGLALFADDLVTYGIGEKWRPAAVLLQVWGIVAAIGHIGFNWDAYFRARGETKPMAIASFIAAVAFLATALPLLFSHGLRGFAVGVGVQMLAHLACRAYFLGKFFHGFAFLQHAVRAILPSVPAAGAVLLMRLAEGDRSFAHVVAEIVVYLGITAALTWWWERGLLREVLGYVRARRSAVVAA